MINLIMRNEQMIKVYLNKFLMKTVGKFFPNMRHPFGKIGNMLRCFFARGIASSVGKNCRVEKGAEIHEGVILHNNAFVGPNALVQKGTEIYGNNWMAPNVHIYSTGHKYSEELHTFDGKLDINPVTIYETTWIGYGVIILPGVTIGRNTIIGAGSVVTKSIPAGVMAAGNPCVVKKIIDQEIYKKYNQLESEEESKDIKENECCD